MKKIRTHYEDGQLKEEYTINENKKKHGLYRKYINGRTVEESHWKDGKKDGKYLSWYEGGQLNTKTSYLNNSIYGKYISYTKDGLCHPPIYYLKGVEVSQEYWEKYKTCIKEALKSFIPYIDLIILDEGCNDDLNEYFKYLKYLE